MTVFQLLETCLKGRFTFLEVPHEVKEIIMNTQDEMIINTFGHVLHARPFAEPLLAFSPIQHFLPSIGLRDLRFSVLVQEILDELD